MATFVTQAIILAITDHSESDRQYTIYSDDHGKLQVIAKGAKKVLSKVHPHLPVGSVVEIMIATGRVFDRVATAHIVTHHRAITGDVSAMIIASYFFDVVDALVMRQAPDRDVFTIILDFLQHLDQAENTEQRLLVLNHSLLALLQNLGYESISTTSEQRQLFEGLYKTICEVSDRGVRGHFLVQQVLAHAY
jgi:DNA repair protein RecO (recombination protein O)